MKTLNIIISALLICFFLSCSSEENAGNLISYDGENSTAPLLPAGTHEMALYFPSSVMSDFAGRTIKNVRTFVYAPPSQLEIIIYEGNSAQSPGSELYRKQFVGLIRENTWNIHAMEPRLELDGSPVWVAVRFSHSGVQQTIGCDSGPANENGGDWLYRGDDMEWKTFRERTGDSVNWNIRVELVE